ncbi:azurin [Wenzhouxiangella sp. XN79A]|uniref:azurin n=1 Tax=Wenzhouxiangella sp. XN79A TaxID=2724193 RepID=UPI00144A5658|nr:azurin [Wenzhouxiangella sp. XN79A]NKI35371.1 azurin [Wenzhouxiangella sp. XN79A]
MTNSTRLAAAIALLAAAFSPAAFAACDIEIAAGDNLAFDRDVIEVDASCETVTVTLTHTGSLPAAAMGHNWVLSRTADYQDIGTAGMSAGLEQDYLPPGDDRVIAATRIIGGGETAEVSFSLEDLDPDGDYTFFCSFPGHWGVMKGKFRLL